VQITNKSDGVDFELIFLMAPTKMKAIPTTAFDDQRLI
jgi:hypothetical protein